MTHRHRLNSSAIVAQRGLQKVCGFFIGAVQSRMGLCRGIREKARVCWDDTPILGFKVKPLYL
jgi:hypothetical protein